MSVKVKINDEATKRWAALMVQQVERQNSYFERLLKDLPPPTRRQRIAAKVRSIRQRLGEWIAGREFDV